MLPVGAYYNKDLQSAKIGDLIKIYAGEPYCEIKRITYLDLHSGIANMLSFYIYSRPLSILMRLWRSKAVLFGNNKNSVSENKCLVIQYEKPKQ